MTNSVDAAVLLSVLLGAATAGRLRAGGPAGARAGGRGVTPFTALLGVTALLYLNQVLFTVYILDVHGGDPSFVAQYLPTGWFHLADDTPVLRWLAAHFPAPFLLAPSVLRVQAFLELPFVLLAFATALRWLDATLYRRVFRSALLPLAAVAYTGVFCIVEWDLRNPYTVQDIVVRACSAVITPLLLAALAARDPAAPDNPGPLSAVRLLVFIGSLGALGVLVLVVYDTALLYNLGRLGARTPLAAGAVATLALLRLAAARRPVGPTAGLAVTFIGHALRRWLVLFFVPALTIRYGVTFGTPALAAGAAVLLAGTAAGWALRDTLSAAREAHAWRPALVLPVQLGGAVLAGAAAAYAAAHGTTAAYYEVPLLQAASAFLGTAVAVCVGTDRAVARVRRAATER
ncbi:hypothetical protein ABZ721_14590 [Streptomyces sp. NPDC006733]|uniref:hypothetical protein n=1 Tax=Streptomyces sp. NPDC006733 TaxID=3155460 RepID=UPI0033EDBDC8